ncbi:hypothetical protein [Mandarin fish ranavirus]|nr:hypothetical protein [Mandarin fish ranavirus]
MGNILVLTDWTKSGPSVASKTPPDGKDAIMSQIQVVRGTAIVNQGIDTNFKRVGWRNGSHHLFWRRERPWCDPMT